MDPGLEWVDWFKHRRIFHYLGRIPPAEFERAHYVHIESGHEMLTQTTELPGEVHTMIGAIKVRFNFPPIPGRADGAVLFIIGIVAAVWAWNSVNPSEGLLVGLLVVVVTGRRLLGALLGIVVPSRRQAHLGDGYHAHQPSKAFQPWLAEFQLTAPVMNGEWIDGLPRDRAM